MNQSLVNVSGWYSARVRTAVCRVHACGKQTLCKYVTVVFIWETIWLSIQVRPVCVSIVLSIL